MISFRISCKSLPYLPFFSYTLFVLAPAFFSLMLSNAGIWLSSFTEYFLASQTAIFGFAGIRICASFVMDHSSLLLVSGHV